MQSMPVQNLALIPNRSMERQLNTSCDQDIHIIFHPNKKDAFKVYADAGFLGNWIKNYAELDPATAES